MNEDRETIGKYVALSKMELTNNEQAEIWNQVQRRMMESASQTPPRRRSHILEKSAAVVATIAVISGGIYAYSNYAPKESSHPRISASKTSLPKFPLPSDVKSIYTSEGNPAQTKWTTKNVSTATQKVLKWLESSTLYTGTIPKTKIVVGSYVGPAQVHIQTAGNSQFTIFPANHVVLENGQYKPIYVPNVVGYRRGNHTTYLKSPQLFSWLKNNDWKNTFRRPVNPLFRTSLTLPNGQKVTTSNSVKWKNLNVQIQIQGIPQHQPRYYGIVGNHSTIMSHTTVTTSAGKATLVLNKRTPPAAAKSSAPTYEYWVIVYRSEYAYAIEATITGSVQNAKAQVMQLLHGWKVPK